MQPPGLLSFSSTGVKPNVTRSWNNKPSSDYSKLKLTVKAAVLSPIYTKGKVKGKILLWSQIVSVLFFRILSYPQIHIPLTSFLSYLKNLHGLTLRSMDMCSLLDLWYVGFANVKVVSSAFCRRFLCLKKNTITCSQLIFNFSWRDQISGFFCKVNCQTHFTNGKRIY